MTWHDVREQALRIIGLFHRKRAEQELADEMEFHLAMSRRKHASEAAARHDLGSVEKWKDACRDVGRSRPIEDFVRDLALAVRMLRKTPAFTAVAVTTLALAIGANTAIFSLMNALLLRPLAVPQAQRLVILRLQPDNYGYSFCYPIFQYVHEHSPVFSDVFAFAPHQFHAHGATGTELVPGAEVSGQYFIGLRVAPQLGRYLLPGDDRPGGGSSGPVVVISDRFWHRWEGGDRRVIGRSIVLDNVAFTIAGVMPPGFTGAELGVNPDIFMPLALEPLVDAPYDHIGGGYHVWWLRIGGRLKNGVSAEQADAFLRGTSQAALQAAIPDPKWSRNEHTRSDIYLTAEPGATGFSYLRLQFRRPLQAVMALVAMVLLIACLNLATLLMARSAAREREVATRFALGASRGRLLRQLLTESLLLAVTGTVLGVLAAPVLARTLSAFFGSQQNPPQIDVSPDVRVFAFTAAVAALATVLTGMAPALRSTGRELQQRTREAGAALRGADRRRLWPRILLAGEVALALVLVTGAGLLGYSLVRLHSIPTGFDARGVVLLPLDMTKQSRDGAALIGVYRDIENGLRQLPGVTAASFVSVVPMSNGSWTGDLGLPARPRHHIYLNQTGHDYFRAMKTPLLAGRDFRWSDTDGSPSVAIVNQTAAQLFFDGANPLGSHFLSEDGKQTTEIIGVVADTKYDSLRDAAPPTVYKPITQDIKDTPSLTAVLRVQGSAVPVIAGARAVIRRAAPDIPVPPALTMEGRLDEALATERMMATLALFFAAIAVLITGIGLYGTLAYTTERRTGEIGIRMALGARQADVMSMVCRENAVIALAGCIAGMALSLLASRLVSAFLYSTSPRDPAVLGPAVLVLGAIAAAASAIPALRAARIDPIAAIRYE